MPEMLECFASWMLVNKRFQELKEATSWKVKAMYADSTKAEETDIVVYQLDATSKVTRGNTKAQTPLYPPMWRLANNGSAYHIIQSGLSPQLIFSSYVLRI